jgi:hypothetical protein
MRQSSVGRPTLTFPAQVLMVQWPGREREIHDVYRQKVRADEELERLKTKDIPPIWAEVQTWNIEW